MRERLARLREGDWRTALLAVAAAVLVAFVVAELVGTSWLLIDPEDDPGIAPTSGGEWLRHVCSTVGSAFWSPILIDTGSDGFLGRFASAGVAPLTVTVPALAAFYAVLRRAPRTAGTAFANALRAAVPFALVIGLVSLLGRNDLLGEGELAVRTTFPEPAFFAFATAMLVGMLAYRDLWAPLPGELRGVRDRWWLALRGALVGLGTGFGISAVVALGLLLGHHDRLGGWTNVARALPAFFGFLPNAAVALFSVGTGGRLQASAGPGLYVSLLHRHDLSAWYWLLVLVPLVAIAVSVRYVARRRGDRTDAEVAGTVLRAAVLAAALWWLSAIVSRMTFGAGLLDLGGRGSLGAGLFWGMLTVGAAFALLGWVFARYAARRYPAGTDVTRPSRPRAVSLPPYRGVLALAALAVALAGLGAVVADQNVETGGSRPGFDQSAGAP